MKWPRGKHNGQRIVGVVIRMEIDILNWWCVLRYRHGLLTIFMGPVHVWINANFEW